MASRLFAAGLLASLAAPGCPSSGPAAPAPRTNSIPAAEFLFGLCQAEGTGTIPPALSPLTHEQLGTLRDSIGINSIRIFVHPTLVGLPQRTWQGPEPIRYSSFDPSAYNFSALDSLLGSIVQAGLFPIVLPLPVDEYTNFMYLDNLTRFNNATATPPRDYAGISAVDEVTAFTSAVAKHIQGTFATPFGIAFTEFCGQAPAGPSQRTHERGRWEQLVAALRRVAPLAEIYGPELCLSLSWYDQLNAQRTATCSRDFTTLAAPTHFDSLGNYAAAFDAPAYSFYSLAYLGAPDNTPRKACNTSEALAITDTVTKVVRPHIGGKRWLWSEHGWGSTQNFFLGKPVSTDAANNTAMDLMHQNWATLFFGLDHARGAMLWQAKDSCTIPAACTGTGILDSTGQPHDAFDAWKAIGAAVRREWRFMRTYHTALNAHGVPVADPNAFVSLNEGDGVITRLLNSTLAVYVDSLPGSTAAATLRLGSLTGHHIVCLLCEQSPGVDRAVTIEHSNSSAVASVTVSGLTPRRFYLFTVSREPARTVRQEQHGTTAAAVATPAAVAKTDDSDSESESEPSIDLSRPAISVWSYSTSTQAVDFLRAGASPGNNSWVDFFLGGAICGGGDGTCDPPIETAKAAQTIGVPALYTVRHLFFSDRHTYPAFPTLAEAENNWTAFKPKLPSAGVLGFFIGDELGITNGTASDPIAERIRWAADRIRADFPNAIIYVNALCATVTGNEACSATQKSAGYWSSWIGTSNITWISQDFYTGGDDANPDEADYVQHIYPYLRPDQKVVLIPQVWVPRAQCANSSVVADHKMAGNNLRHLAWAMEDSRVAAVIPFALGCAPTLPDVTCAFTATGEPMLMDQPAVASYYRAFSSAFAPRCAGCIRHKEGHGGGGN